MANLAPLVDPNDLKLQGKKAEVGISNLFASSIASSSDPVTTPRTSLDGYKSSLPVVLPAGYSSPRQPKSVANKSSLSQPGTPKGSTSPRTAANTSPKYVLTSPNRSAHPAPLSPGGAADSPRSLNKSTASSPRSYMDNTVSSSARVAATSSDHAHSHHLPTPPPPHIAFPKKSVVEPTISTSISVTAQSAVPSTGSSVTKTLSKFQQFCSQSKSKSTSLSGTASETTESSVTSTYNSESTVPIQVNAMHSSITPREKKVLADSGVRSQSPLITRSPRDSKSLSTQGNTPTSPQVGKRLTQQRESYDPSASSLPSNNVTSKVKSFEGMQNAAIYGFIDNNETTEKPRAPSRTSRSSSIMHLQEKFMQKSNPATTEPSPPANPPSRTRSKSILRLQEQFEQKATVQAPPPVRPPSRGRGELVSRLQEQYISEATKSSGSNSAQSTPRLSPRQRSSSGASLSSQSTGGLATSSFAIREKLALFSNTVRETGGESVPNSSRSSLPSTSRTSMSSLPNSARAATSTATAPVPASASGAVAATSTRSPVTYSLDAAAVLRDRNRMSTSPKPTRTVTSLQGEKSPAQKLPTKTVSVLKTAARQSLGQQSPGRVKQVELTPVSSPARARPSASTTPTTPNTSAANITIYSASNTTAALVNSVSSSLLATSTTTPPTMRKSEVVPVSSVGGESVKVQSDSPSKVSNFPKSNRLSVGSVATTSSTKSPAKVSSVSTPTKASPVTVTASETKEAADLRYAIGEATLRIQELEEIYRDSKLSFPVVPYNLPAITSFVSSSESSKTISRDLLLKTISSNSVLATIPGLNDMTAKELFYVQDLVNEIDSANIRMQYLEDRLLLAGVELPEPHHQSVNQSFSIDSPLNLSATSGEVTSDRRTSSGVADFVRRSAKKEDSPVPEDKPETTHTSPVQLGASSKRSVVDKEKFSSFMKSANQHRPEASPCEEDIEAERLAQVLSKEVTKAKMRISFLENKLRKAQLPTAS